MNLKLHLIVILYSLCDRLVEIDANLKANTFALNAKFNKSQFNQLKDFLDQSVNNFKDQFHRSFEESRIRHKAKNNFLFKVPAKGVLIEEHLKVTNFSESFPVNVLSGGQGGPNGPIRMWTAFSDGQNTLLFWGHSNGLLVLADFRFTPKGSVIGILGTHLEQENGVPFKAKHFIYGPNIWFVVLFTSSLREYVAVYQYIPGHGLHRRQTIETDFGSDFDIISRNYTYMAVSSRMRRTSSEKTRQSTLRLFEWRHTQFDFIAEQKTLGATAVRLFEMRNVVFMAVSQNYNDSMRLQTNYNHIPDWGSHIFLYNAREDEKLTFVQTIENMATNVEHFKVDGIDYLVFVRPHNNSIIYWWSGDSSKFRVFQHLHRTVGATDVSVARMPNNEILLGLLYPNRVEFFTESVGAKYTLNGYYSIPEPAFVAFKLFSYTKRHFFSVFTMNDFLRKPMNSIWKLTLVSDKTADYYVDDPLRSCLLKLEQTMSKRENELKQLTERANKVWLSNTPQTITAPVVVEGKVRVQSFSARTVMITNGNKRVPQITNTDIKIRTDMLANRVDVISNDLKTVAFKSRNQTIRGRIVFAEAIGARHATLGHIVNRDVVVSGVPFNALMDSVLQVNGNQVIGSHFTVNRLTVDRLDINGLINDLNVNDALLANWPHPQVVTGNHRYADLVIDGNLVLHQQFGTLNGIHPNHFVTKNGINQQINGQKVFGLLNAKAIDVTGSVNGRDLSSVFARAVRLNGPKQVITGEFVMDAPISVDRMTINGLINGLVNITEIAFNGVTIYGEQTIAGKKTFLRPVGVMGSIQLGGYVNGLKLSRDVMTTNTVQEIRGNIDFMSSAEFMSNIVSNNINGMDLSEDSVRRNVSQPQYVNRKVFEKTLFALNDITMDSGSTLDGVDPSEVIKLAISNRNTAFEGPVSFDRLIVSGNIFAKSVNNFPVNDLPNILWLKTYNQTIRVPVVFEGVVKLEQLLSQNINRFSVPKDFVRRYSDAVEVITSPKTFVDEVVIKGNFELKDDKRINGIDLNAWERQVVQINTKSRGYILGEKRFKSMRVMSNVFADFVNGLDITKDLMLTNFPQTIKGNIRLMSPWTHINARLDVMSDINVMSTLNNHSLSQFVADLVVTNRWPLSYQRPVINKVFAAGVGVKRLTADGSVDGVDINDMKRRVVTLDTRQAVVSPKNFKSETVFKNDIITENVNGLKIREFLKRVVQRDQPTVVRGFKTFNGNVVFGGNLDVNGLINGIDIRSLQRRVMSRTRDNVLLGPIVFKKDLNLGRLFLSSPATIDGIRFDDLAIIRNSIFPLVLRGSNEFMRGLTARTDITVNKTVNGCDLRQLQLNSVLHNTKSHFQSIHSTKQFTDLEVLGNVVINGPLNGIDFNRMVSKMVTLTGDQVLTAPLTFEDDVIVDRLIVKNLINGRDVAFVFKDAVLKSVPQVVGSRKNFVGTLYSNGTRMQVRGLTEVAGLVNRVDVVALNRTAVRHHSTEPIAGNKTFIGRVTFKRDVTITGTLNGLNIPNDLILVYTNEVIPGVTRFLSWISCEKRLNVNKLIDGIELSHFVANRLTVNGSNEVMESFLNFTNKVTVDRLIVKKTINGIPVGAFVTRRGTHFIDGVKTFAEDLYVKGSVHSPGIYNSIDVHDLAKRAVSLKRPEMIPGVTEFRAPVSVKKMDITGRLNGYDISDMANFFNRYTTEVNALLGYIKEQLNRQGQALEVQFASHLNMRSSGIDYFVLMEENFENLKNVFNSTADIELMASDGHRYRVSANGKRDLYFDNSCSYDHNSLYSQPIHVYRLNGQTYDFFQSIDINGVISLSATQVANQTYIAAASRLLGKTFLLQLRGYNKFEVIETLPTTGVQNVRFFYTVDGILHLAITSDKSLKILTAVMKGSHIEKMYRSIDQLLIDSKLFK